jgi:type II secretory pathway predicted ATPase ExeA
MQTADRLLASLGLGFNPFSIAINQNSYYETAATRRIMKLIEYGAETRKGFMLLSGEVGVGKSSLLLRLMARLKNRGMVTAMVVNSLLDKKELLENICADFGLKHRPGLNTSHLLIVLHTFFLHQFKKGLNCVILVDEAHHLGYEALESLRMLANLETNGVKLVQILICGQPELRERLQDRRLRQFASRISIGSDLPALNRAETTGYVEFKLAQAGSQIRPSAQAGDLLWSSSQGNPRTVNLLMERCLYAMVARGRDVIDVAIMRAAIQDLEICRCGPSRQPQPGAGRFWNWLRWPGWCGLRGAAGFAGSRSVVLFIVAIALGWFLGHGGLQAMVDDGRTDAATTGQALSAKSGAPLEAASYHLVSADIFRHLETARRQAETVKDIGLKACVLRHESSQGPFYTVELGRGLSKTEAEAARDHYGQYFSSTVHMETHGPEKISGEQVYCSG